MSCQVGKMYCRGCEYAKEGKCDWPYRKGMLFEEIKQITQPKTRVRGSENDNCHHWRECENEPEPEDE